MADDSNAQGPTGLPPKLDLRKKGILRSHEAAEAPQADAAPAADATADITITPPAGAAEQAAPAAAAQPVVVPAADDGKRPTIRLTPAAQAPAAAAPQAAAPRPASKKETSRIPLEAAVAASDPAPSAPKTVRIKPAQTQPLAASDAAADGEDTKRKTSRISLEAALAADQAGKGEAPKTIKLKRPAEAATVKLSPAPAAAATAGAAVPAAQVPAAEPEAPAMGKTARLDEDLQGEEDGATPTKRKTIRVKRPTQRPGVKPSVSVARSPSSAAQPGMEAAFAAPQASVGWLAPVLSIAAILVCCVLIYVLAAQAYPGLGLSWPGAIV